MKWLTSRQALADNAQFIQFAILKYNLTKETKWIAIGGSYSGPWNTFQDFKINISRLPFRLDASNLPQPCSRRSLQLRPCPTYCRLFSWAANYSNLLTVPPEYYSIASDDLRKVSEECWGATDEAFNTVVEIHRTEEGRDRLKKELNLCHMVPKSQDGMVVLEILDKFKSIVRYTELYYSTPSHYFSRLRYLQVSQW